MTYGDFLAIFLVASAAIFIGLPWWGVLIAILSSPLLALAFWAFAAAVAPESEEGE